MKFKHKKHSRYGCDTRVVTKFYLHTPGLRKLYGDRNLKKVLGDLIEDPPIPISDPGYYGLSPQGVNIIETDGVYHVWDWIGADNYPNASDIWMQIIEKDDNTLVDIKHTKFLEKLVAFESKRVLIHPHGQIDNPSMLKENRVPILYVDDCFLDEGNEYRAYHLEVNEQMCSSLWWQCCPGKPIEDNERYTEVEVGDLTYIAGLSPKNYHPEWKLAVIGKVPVTEGHLVVGDMTENEDDVNEIIEKAVEYLEKTVYGIPLYATDN